jgi:CBS domain containing-hemolysin-like protein
MGAFSTSLLWSVLGMNFFLLFMMLLREIFRMINTKFLLFRRERINYVLLSISILWLIIMILFIFYTCTTPAYDGYTIPFVVSLVFFIFLRFMHIILGVFINKRKWNIKDFKKLDYPALLKEYDQKYSKEVIRNAITRKSKAGVTLQEKYSKLSERIATVNSANYIPLLADVVVFNEENHKLFDPTYNHILYKMTLYLLWDIQKNIK